MPLDWLFTQYAMAFLKFDLTT
ncbi:MAG: hypothetical protein FD183_1128, partial [Chitinophagaceae bacterium]